MYIIFNKYRKDMCSFLLSCTLPNLLGGCTIQIIRSSCCCIMLLNRRGKGTNHGNTSWCGKGYNSTILCSWCTLSCPIFLNICRNISYIGSCTCRIKIKIYIKKSNCVTRTIIYYMNPCNDCLVYCFMEMMFF